MQPWWERWPGRLEYELAALDALGIPYERDEDALRRGAIKLKVQPTVEGVVLDLVAIFPDLYPYFRFEVYAPDLTLPHHQNPFEKNLCLLGRGTHNWRTQDTLAEFIQTRLPTVLQAGESNDLQEVDQLEEHQGEPFSDYYRYQKDTLVLIDSSWSLNPEVTQGDLLLGLDQDGAVLRGAVLEVTAGSQILAQADSALRDSYSTTIRGRWVRVQEPIRENDGGRFVDTLKREYPHLTQGLWQKNGEVRIDVIGVVFPEEVRWRDTADGWVFSVRIKEAKGSKHKQQETYLARAGRVGLEDMRMRIPELVHLNSRRVAVIGLGTLGAPSAIELARGGLGELRLMDGDIVEPGTSVRWPFGVPVAGRFKAEILASFLNAHYPYCNTLSWTYRIGGITGDGSDLRVLSQVLDGVDLIYDATAEIGVQHLLSELAAEKSIPYICVSSTLGAWGGLMARVRPGLTQGCWFCLQQALTVGAISNPHFDLAGNVQPVGCADPTFTGAGFDLGQIALSGARFAVQTLGAGAESAYPDVDWDVAVLSLRDEVGRAIAPHWETFALDRHPLCERCPK